MRRFLFAAAVIALTGLTARAQVINEFMADNEATLMDEDSEFNDWIEIYNQTGSPVYLDGWYLTDSATDPTQWEFPAVTLGGDGYLVVFASGKDRRDPAGELHTNFRLSTYGEYLGLITPDGMTPASEFVPAYPPQVPDVPFTYGLSPIDGSKMVFHTPTPGWENVPEPTTVWLLWAGVLARIRRRKR